ncbi:MAG: DUF4124 domain-containing protein [Lysobacteraceae bacterium]
MRVMSIFVFSFAFAIAISHPSAIAQGVIYKCVGSGGAATYQNSPCPAGSAERAVKPYAALPYDPSLAEKVRRDRLYLDERSRRQSAGGGDVRQSAGPVNQKVLRCRDARAKRQAALDAWGLARTYDLLQRLDREVWEACKDAPGA